MIQLVFNFQLLNYPSLIQSDSNGSKSLVEGEGRARHLDALTAMFYHAENTRKCGDNLQSFDVDMRPLWVKRFAWQRGRLFSLANSLNHLMGSMGGGGGGSRASVSEVHLIESSILPALSYFLFQSDRSSVDQATLKRYLLLSFFCEVPNYSLGLSVRLSVKSFFFFLIL